MPLALRRHTNLIDAVEAAAQAAILTQWVAGYIYSGGYFH